ncbi:hypothetical protein INT47_000269 [Mucor saturninus]|uniref:Uncharacterized protein n=1 Tax=Mucor saturninus TaxID=64648 RepID=A0A8H7QE63_9FUNG|nr:hypothetical protein INT47_000269 [Mucor saturninus]
MGKVTGDSRWNTRGTKLCKTIRDKGIINWNAKLQYKKYTRINFQVHNNTTENSIVDYFLSPNDLQQPTLTIRDDLAILESDHKLMTLSFMWDNLISAESENTQQQRKRWKINRLIDHDKQTTGQKTGNDSGINRYKVEQIFDRHATHDGVNQLGSNLVYGGVEVKQARTAAYHKFCEKLDDDPTAAIRIVKRIIQSKNKNTHRYTTEEGPQHAVNSMAQYLEGIFDGSNLPKPQNQIIHTTNTTNNSNTNTTEPLITYDFYDCPFTENHIYNAIKRLPNKKSPGSDHITSEMIKPIIDSTSTILNHLFRISWITGYTPALWRQSQIVPIYKGAGNQTQPNN